MKRRVAQFLSSTECPVCAGKQLKPEALSVTFAGMDISELSRLPLKRLDEIAKASPAKARWDSDDHPEKALVVKRIVDDLRDRWGSRLKRRSKMG